MDFVILHNAFGCVIDYSTPSFLEFLLYLNAKKSRQGKVSTQSYPNPAKQFGGKFLLRGSQPLIFSLELLLLLLLLPKEVSDI